jgi:hypothetical protein
MVERANGFLETSFLPGRVFASPNDFNAQLTNWLERANGRTVRSIHGRPADLFDTDYLSMIPLTPVDPLVGLHQWIRLARDYYVRVDTVDYSVDPRMIGRLVDVTATPTTVTATCDGHLSLARRDPGSITTSLPTQSTTREPPGCGPGSPLTADAASTPAGTPMDIRSPCARCRTTTPCSESTSPFPQQKRVVDDHHHTQVNHRHGGTSGQVALDVGVSDSGIEDPDDRALLGGTRRSGPRRESVT